MTLAKSIGCRIKAAREEAGLSRRALARATMLDNMSLCGYEHGKNLPGAKAVIALCRALGISADSLLGLPPMDPLVELDEKLDRTVLSHKPGEMYAEKTKKVIDHGDAEDLERLCSAGAIPALKANRPPL